MNNRFLQLHFLTPYPPSNLNRDDLGRPKTALYGGALRLRVSSQSLKRAWRTSDVFKQQLEGHIGLRTKQFGELVVDTLKKGLNENKATVVAAKIAAQFGKVADKNISTEQLAHITPEERGRLDALASKHASEKREPSDEELNSLLAKARGAADIALFGRMLASKPELNTEAACQVAHAISVHKVAVEDDYFSAVDDLKEQADEAGAGHIGTHEFASAVMYHYVCVDRELLADNLGGDQPLLKKTLAALGATCLTVAPSGKQSSFGSRARAHYALVEASDAQPRSLASAFLKPVMGEDLLVAAVNALEETKKRLDTVYADAPTSRAFNVTAGTGAFKDIVSFMTEL